MTKDAMDMTLAELLTLQNGLTGEEDPAQVRALDKRIRELEVEAAVDKRMASFEAKKKAEDFDATARKRWKGLQDKESDFYKAVNEELERRGDSKTNPLALLDAANKVGLERGDVQEGWVPSADTQAIMKIKPSGNPEEGSSKRLRTERNSSFLDTLAKEGFLDKNDEASMARINAEDGEDK